MPRASSYCLACCTAAGFALQTWAEAGSVRRQVTGAVGWRKDSIKYKKNEVFLDIVEQAWPQLSSHALQERAMPCCYDPVFQCRPEAMGSGVRQGHV